MKRIIAATLMLASVFAMMPASADGGRSSVCPTSNSQGAVNGNTSAAPVAGANSSSTNSAYNFGSCGGEGPYRVACRIGGDSVVLAPPAGTRRVIFVWYNSVGSYVDSHDGVLQSNGSYAYATSSSPAVVRLDAQIQTGETTFEHGYVDCH